MGDATLHSITVVAMAAPPVMAKAVEEARLGSGCDPLSPIDKIKDSMLYNACRAKFGYDLVDVSERVATRLP